MRSLTIIFTLSAAIAIFAAKGLAEFDQDAHTQSETAPSEIQESTSYQGRPRLSHLLAEQNLKASVKCDKFPRICRVKNSRGPDCCKKKCVNVKTDRLNCGMCGYKCRYNEICCKGRCVNASWDKRNCGGCKKKCKRGEFCVYGMCNYAN